MHFHAKQSKRLLLCGSMHIVMLLHWAPHMLAACALHDAYFLQSNDRVWLVLEDAEGRRCQCMQGLSPCASQLTQACQYLSATSMPMSFCCKHAAMLLKHDMCITNCKTKSEHTDTKCIKTAGHQCTPCKKTGMPEAMRMSHGLLPSTPPQSLVGS